MSSNHQGDITGTNKRENIYFVGGLAAVITVLVGVIEIMITFLPGGNSSTETVFDWFRLFQYNPFMGLRNLGLLNILFNALGILTFSSLYAAQRRKSPSLAAVAVITSFIGIAVFFATNRAFAMLAVSNQYAAATNNAQRNLLAAVGQSMLSVGQSHTPGTFIAFALSETAGILISICMLRDKIFSKVNAFVGIIGFGMLLIFEISISFVLSIQDKVMVLAMFGGIFSLIWDILVAQKLLQLSKLGKI